MAYLPDAPPLLSAALALAFVLGLVWLAGRLAPRLLSADRASSLGARSRGPARLTRMETLVLGPRHRLHLVRCDGRDVLLLTGGPQDLVIGWLAGHEP